ncbi:MAG: hypothetical protein FJX56_05300 [Alphaproteobacteria bacterium]|nr:hypothetical protein [Alphaproteobacteria bacterium]
MARIDDYFDWAAARGGHRRGQRVPFDAEAYRRYVAHQIPGGMMSNFRRQLSEAGILDRMPLILDEVTRVRAEVGYPPMITPYSQMVGVQAVLNVMSGERYANVPRELALYLSGQYGQICGPVDPGVYDRATGGVNPQRFDFTAPDAELAALRTAHPEMSEDALLLRLFFGQRAFETYERKRTPADPMLIATSPLAELVREVLVRRKAHRLTVRASGGLSYADVRASAAYLEAAPNAGELAVTHRGLHVAAGRQPGRV